MRLAFAAATAWTCVASGCDGPYVAEVDQTPVPQCWDFDTQLGIVGRDDRDLTGYSPADVAVVVQARPSVLVDWEFPLSDGDRPLDPVVGIDLDLTLDQAFAVDRVIPPGVWQRGYLDNGKCIDGRLLRIPAVVTMTLVYDGTSFVRSGDLLVEAGAADPAVIGFGLRWDFPLDETGDAWMSLIGDGLKKDSDVDQAGGSLNGTLLRGYVGMSRTRANVAEVFADGFWSLPP